MSAAFAVVGLCFLLQPLECSRIPPNDNPYSAILGSLPVEGPGPTGQRLKLDNDAMPPRTLLWPIVFTEAHAVGIRDHQEQLQKK